MEYLTEMLRGALEITGTDVTAFADELVRGEQSCYGKLRQNLNSDILKKLGKEFRWWIAGNRRIFRVLCSSFP